MFLELLTPAQLMLIMYLWWVDIYFENNEIKILYHQNKNIKKYELIVLILQD